MKAGPTLAGQHEMCLNHSDFKHFLFAESEQCPIPRKVSSIM